MFDIGFLELLLVGIIGLIILGPERLPIAARTLGKWVGRARRLVSQFSREIDKEIEIEELKTELKKQGKSLDINKDVRQIHETVSQALKEAEQDSDKVADKELIQHSGEYEPLPRKEPDMAFLDQPSIEPNQPSSTQPPSSAASTTTK
jgi:sec-independent protein translocase protein TatB